MNTFQVEKRHLLGLQAIADWVEPTSSESEALSAIVAALQEGKAITLKLA